MRSLLGLLVLALLGLGGCVPSAARVRGGLPVPDPDARIAELKRSTLPATPLQVNFDWDLNEGGSRVRGRGVVRLEAPDRIRLDLFGPRGETYLSAGLVDERYYFPGGAAPPVELPSPALLWGALGVFQPPTRATLASATADSLRTDIEFVDPDDDRWIFHFAAGPSGADRLTGIEREGRRGLVESVQLEWQPTGSIAQASYRDWSQYRDLVLRVSEIRESNPFPSDIWTPGAPSF